MPTIEHVVVLMMENRSFDHIFGFRPGVKGLTGKEFNLPNPASPESKSNARFTVDQNAPYAVLAGRGPGHSVNATNTQLCNSKTGPSSSLPATNNGFVANYQSELRADKVQKPTPAMTQVVMQSFAPGKLPSISALADHFCLCDHWYADVPGPTQPNRFYMHAATSDGFALNTWQRQLDVPTIYNRLSDAGHTWAVYSIDVNEVLEFSQVNKQTANFKPFEEHFQDDAAKGNLPNYSFIVPRFLNSKTTTGIGNGQANSQHAPQDARYGDNFIADVYDAVRAGPGWEKTLLVVLYDEHGGFYDHVVPPSQNIPNPDGKTSPSAGDPSYAPKFGFDRLGMRVPALIVSPWVKAGIVDSTQYQHTSVLATVKEMFGLKDFLTARDKGANRFTGLLNLSSPRTDTPLTLPRVALPAAATTSLTDPAHPANQPLDDTQQDALENVFHLTKGSQSGKKLADLPVKQGEAHDFIVHSLNKHFGLKTK
jgi:phospholipase C